MVEFDFPGPIIASRNRDVGVIGIFMHSVSLRHRYRIIGMKWNGGAQFHRHNHFIGDVSTMCGYIY